MMKKLLFILMAIIALSFGANSQTDILANGDFESWDDANHPTSWSKAENIDQESGSGLVHGGTYSAKHTGAGTKDLGQYISGIVPGEEYVLTIWYKVVENDGTDARIWSYWRDNDGSLPDNADELRGPNGGYLDNNGGEWTMYTVAVTAPAAATEFYFEVRTYSGAITYWDDFSFVYGGIVIPIINNAYSLSDDAIDVHYSSDMSSVDATDYVLYTDGGGRAPVTFTTATIDGSNPRLVHLNGASEAIVGDLTIDVLEDDESGTQFYAGITPIALTNTTNPGGHIDNGEQASFIGIVSANDNYNNVWISDGAGEREGVLLFDYNFDGLVAVGDSILITANRSPYNDLTELVNPELITLFSSGNTPHGPAMIPGSDIVNNIPSDTDPAEKWEGQLVQIEHFTVVAYDAENYYYDCTWDDGREIFNFIIADNVDYHLNNVDLNVGQAYYHITGVVDHHNYYGYRLNPRNQDDVDDGIYIDVTDPNGGETLVQGTQYDITWDYGEPYWTETEIAIYIDDGVGKEQLLITESTPVANGSYTWTVWSSIEPGDDFMIHLESPEGTQDSSDDFFSIVTADELIADFEADTTLLYVGDSVLFTDLTIGTPTSWLWTFEGGTPATFDGEEPPYIVYSEAGLWDVSLEVSDGTSTDELVMLEYIEVMELPDLPPPVDLQGEISMNYLDVELSWLAPGAGDTFEDDFESYDDFVLEFAPWTNLDVDGSATYGMEGVDWPNSGSPQAFIIFNPSTTTPPVDDMPPHSGDKLAACLAAVPSPTNDDWLITPILNMGSAYTLSFWAKSYTDLYGLERFRVGVSTTGMDPTDFTIISAGDYVEAPVEDWTEFTYDLSAYAGEDVYIGIQCVSNDAFIFMVDDVTIGSAKSSIVYNPAQLVVGKATKSVNYTAMPTPQPAVTPQSPQSRDAELLGYNVYRDDAQINADLVTETEYLDVEPSIGSHDYYVTAVYDLGESIHSDTVSIVITDINETLESTVTVYPNPSSGKFTIALPTGVETVLNVMDLTGKSVYQTNASETITIDLGNMYKGIYLLNIYDVNNNSSLVKKLVIN